MEWNDAWYWLAFGLLGQLAFFSRFLVQWVASERAGVSYVPVAFWYLSLVGSLILLVYAVHRREMVISLRNFGIFTDDGRQVHDYRKNLFVLKHEVTHQLLHHWIPFLPLWLNEGFPEYIAALHLQDGRYNLREREAAFLRYLNKWRPRDEDTRAIRMLHPARLLTLSHQQWQSALQMETAVLNYNSAALLTYYFLHQDGTGNGASLAGFFNALRLDPRHPSEHIKKHLLRGRTPESIAFHLQGQWRKKGVKIEFVDG